jgi:7-cyano-7-deazaguanine synthase
MDLRRHNKIEKKREYQVFRMPSRGKGRQTRAIVMLSGGLDSTVALYWAMNQDLLIQTLSFNYFLRSKKEIFAARKIASINGVKHREIKLGFLKEIEDSKPVNPVLKKAELAYVPSRNVIFYSIATCFAELDDAKFIVAGHNRDDVRDFPDSSISFFNRFNSLTKIGLFSNDRTGRVILPLAKLSKVRVIELGSSLGVPFELTWSCYRSSTWPCGVCHSCRLRSTAFKQARICDPLMNVE